MNLYGILSIGYGKRTRYMIREIIENGDCPVNGKVFKTEHAAQEEAKKLGIKIIAVGDCYDLATAYRKATDAEIYRKRSKYNDTDREKGAR